MCIRDSYYGMIAQLDHHIGRVLDALAARGLAEDTLVLFTGDHGDFMGDHQMMLKAPIHYEALIRVPLIVHGPGFGVGESVDDPVGTIDIAPTVFDACGLPMPTHLQGRSLRARGREWALTEDDMLRGSFAFRTLTTGRYRLTRDQVVLERSELYDLADDPGELTNRWDDPALRAVRGDLLALLDDVMRHDLGRELPQVCQAG